jgi:hypothetical protein
VVKRRSCQITNLVEQVRVLPGMLSNATKPGWRNGSAALLQSVGGGSTPSLGTVTVVWWFARHVVSVKVPVRPRVVTPSVGGRVVMQRPVKPSPSRHRWCKSIPAHFLASPHASGSGTAAVRPKEWLPGSTPGGSALAGYLTGVGGGPQSRRQRGFDSPVRLKAARGVTDSTVSS